MYFSLLFISFQTHLGRCQLEDVFCENKCGAEVQRRFINNHMLNECPKRQIPCKYCHKEFIFETLQVSSYPWRRLRYRIRYMAAMTVRCNMGNHGCHEIHSYSCCLTGANILWNALINAHQWKYQCTFINLMLLFHHLVYCKMTFKDVLHLNTWFHYV